MGEAHTAPQALFGGAEELLDDVDGALHHAQCAARLVTSHEMAGESVTVAVHIAKNNALGLEAAARAGGPWLEPLADLAVVALHVGGDGLQVGRDGRGSKRGGRARTAWQFVLLQANPRRHKRRLPPMRFSLSESVIGAW